MHRRQLLVTMAGLAAAGTIAGCANPANQTGAGSAPTAATSPAGGTETDAASFPAEVKHRYGTTTVSSAPERIVTLGQTDHDPAIALGYVPIAVSGFVGDDTTYTALRPWNASAFSTEPPVLDMLEIEFEKIATLAPDLILAVMSGITKSDYAKLSAIAPTVAQPMDYEDWAVPFRPHTELVGAALGKPAQASELITKLEGSFATAQQDTPSLGGAKAACAEYWSPDFYVIGSTAPRSQFLVELGMIMPDELSDLVGKDYNATLSAEKVDLLDSCDLIVWTTDHDKNDDLLSNKLVKTLKTTQQGRYVLAPNGGGDDDLLYSMDWGSILSYGWAIEHAVPRLVLAVDGNPATDANAA